jgi:uncharacterized protein YukE
MATLHMNVESVQSAKAKMLSEREAMMAELNSLASQVNGIIGSAWEGNSAKEFQQGFEQLRSKLDRQFEVLAELTADLEAEIAQWQEVASRLG